MKFIISEKNNSSIISAVIISLLIHASVVSFLAFGFAGNLTKPAKSSGINLVWISLDNKSNHDGVAVQKNRPERPPQTVERTVPQTVTIEKPAAPPEISQIHTTAVKESAGAVTWIKYEAPGAGTKAQPDNTAGYSSNKTAGKASNLNTVVAYPLYKENKKPAYPEIARTRGYEGVVLVLAEILPDGRVGNTEISKSSGYAILDQSALQAVKAWKFEPARKSGNPFTQKVQLPIKFNLHYDGSQS